MESKKAFPGSSKLIHNGMDLIDYFACRAPQPSNSEIEAQMRLDKNKNPHNEPHKPKLRSRTEIECCLRYKWASKMLEERENWI